MVSCLFFLERALILSCSTRYSFVTSLSLPKKDSTVITSSHSPSESESVASSHVPFLRIFFFLVPPFAMRHMGGGGKGFLPLMVIPVTSSSLEASSSFSCTSSSSYSSSSEIHSPT